jgi:hypothetical protein
MERDKKPPVQQKRRQLPGGASLFKASDAG